MWFGLQSDEVMTTKAGKSTRAQTIGKDKDTTKGANHDEESNGIG